MAIEGGAEDIHSVGNPGNHPPLGAFGGSDFRVPLNKRTGDRIAFSTHLAAYVARRTPFSGSKVLIPLIKPMVPMEIRSS